jgi:Tfp pilus assembly protein PilW
MKSFIRISEQGVTLLEVMFATAAVSLVLVAVLSTIIRSLQNSRSSLEQAKSTQYSREVLEWLRQERDSNGWVAFAENMPENGTFQVYCLSEIPNGLPALNEKQGTCENENIANTIYTRELTITRPNSLQIEAEVVVSRPDTTGTVTTRTNMTLAEWQ